MAQELETALDLRLHSLLRTSEKPRYFAHRKVSKIAELQDCVVRLRQLIQSPQYRGILDGHCGRKSLKLGSVTLPNTAIQCSTTRLHEKPHGNDVQPTIQMDLFE